MPWSLGRWLPAPLALGPMPVSTLPALAEASRGASSAESPSIDAVSFPPAHLPAMLLSVWLGGLLLFWFVIVWRWAGLRRILRAATPIDEGPVRILFETVALDLGLPRVPDLLKRAPKPELHFR